MPSFAQDPYRSFGYGLFPYQAKAYQRIIFRISDGRPSMLWAGMQAGKSVVCREVSRTIGDNMPQIVIGYGPESFGGFHVTENEYLHPAELTLTTDREEDVAWSSITPHTVVFIDDLFNIPDAEQLYNRICNITPHVVAMGQVGDSGFPISRYLTHVIGPYASWEMNPLLEGDIMRRDRDRRHPTKQDRARFNNDMAASVDTMNAWKQWHGDE
jgi:hypothetical protein